ncbi:MAG: DUF99 family protein [Candidatus Woesearchaeota archaeon]|nr:DUF99 family protein [Candidatus Woesearchaeota archaeon]
MKPESRILGVDDSPFDKFGKKRNVLIVGTLYRGGNFLDGVVSTQAEIDGADGTKKIGNMITGTKFFPQIRAVFLKGIAVAGFNVIDINELSKKTGIPVIVVMRKYPDIPGIKKALSNLKDRGKRFALIRKAGKISRAKVFYRGKENTLFLQIAGTTLKDAQSFLKISCTHSIIPEPLRTAHIIASGIVLGESRGRA